MPCGSSKDTCNQDKNTANGHCAFEDLDHSALQQPLNLGITNVKQILKCIQSGSKEVKDIILNECNIIYECKVCVGLFRSLANFLYHKRCYCKKHLCEDMLLFENFEEEETITVQPQPPKENTQDVSKMADCTVNLEKSDIAQEGNSKNIKSTPDAASKEKNSASCSKVKTKEASEPKKVGNPMISRRTRDKNKQNPLPSSSAKRVSLRISALEEPPVKRTHRVMRLKQPVEVIEIEDTDETTEVKDEEITQMQDADKVIENKEADEAIEMKDEKTIDNKKSNKGDTDKESDKVSGDMECDEIITKEESKEAVGQEESDKIIKDTSSDKCAATDVKKDNEQGGSNKEIKTKRIEFSKIKGTLEKNMPSFPKIIFKTIDSSPHAVYQSDDKKKLETFGIGKKYEATAVETKVDNDKLIIVLKKDVKSDGSSEFVKQKSDVDRASDFHFTRRNRLLARTDCDVSELKCLVCKTQFMSLKTLYFHMLSLHSKKRLYYPCPFCKTLFVQMYGVTRHLVSMHHKTKDQVNKLREVIKKKCVWKKIDDVTPTIDRSFSSLNYQIQNSPPREEQIPESPQKDYKKEDDNTEADSLKTVIKFGKNVTLHQCAKCSRVFGRKSSQVSHEKFCIMNSSVKPEGGDMSPQVQQSPPVVSFLSLPTKSPVSSKPTSIIQFSKPDTTPTKPAPAEKETPSAPVEKKVSIRPKRGAEKRMHKDFVNSQTLKWRSANRVDTSVSKAPTTVKKSNGKSLEKKVLSIMNADDLTCLKCDKKFSSYSNLRRHVAIHVGWTRFKCKYCDYQAYNKSQCWSHIQKTHSVDEEDIDKSIVNLVNNNAASPSKKSQLPETQSSSASKYCVDTSPKTTTKANVVPKVKISKKKTINSAKVMSDKKLLQSVKRDLAEIKKFDKFDKEPDVPIIEPKKEKPHIPVIPVARISRKEIAEAKRDVVDAKKEKSQPNVTFHKVSKKEVSENKKEKPHHIIPIQKLTIPDYKRETNYKSVTTSNPTTIILSKKIPSSTVQSIVTISPESVSSTSKMSPIRTSPRKTETKGSSEKLITTLVTRSSAYSKTSPIQIKLPSASESVDEPAEDSAEKNCTKKERLISEWFPKKDLSSSNIRRSSAPLIIGLVSAGLKAKNSSASPEKNSP